LRVSSSGFGRQSGLSAAGPCRAARSHRVGIQALRWYAAVGRDDFAFSSYVIRDSRFAGRGDQLEKTPRLWEWCVVESSSLRVPDACRQASEAADPAGEQSARALLSDQLLSVYSRAARQGVCRVFEAEFTVPSVSTKSPFAGGFFRVSKTQSCVMCNATSCVMCNATHPPLFSCSRSRLRFRWAIPLVRRTRAC
jgi:hypothetical protein